MSWNELWLIGNELESFILLSTKAWEWGDLCGNWSAPGERGAFPNTHRLSQGLLGSITLLTLMVRQEHRYFWMTRESGRRGVQSKVKDKAMADICYDTKWSQRTQSTCDLRDMGNTWQMACKFYHKSEHTLFDKYQMCTHLLPNVDINKWGINRNNNMLVYTI